MKASEKSYLTDARIYNIYYGMVTRCTNPKDKRWGRYGGRGINVCEEWLDDRDLFIVWAKNNGYEDGLQIDRKNNDGDYEPGNCRWVTGKQNCRNKSTTVYTEYLDNKAPLVDVCEELGVKRSSVTERMKGGYSDVEALEYLTKKLIGFAESKKQKKLNKLRELKTIIDNSYTFFQLK